MCKRLRLLADNNVHSRWRHQIETCSALLVLCAGNSPVTGHWREALMVSLICAWINGWVNNRATGDLRRHRHHYHVIVMDPLVLGYTVECRYNAVQYNKILHTSLQWRGQNINKRLNLQKTHHTSPYRASYGVSFVRIFDKIDRVITAPHCIIA